MNELEAKANGDIKILINYKNKVRKIITDINELKFELGAMRASEIILLVMRFLQHLSYNANSNTIFISTIFIILYSLD